MFVQVSSFSNIRNNVRFWCSSGMVPYGVWSKTLSSIPVSNVDVLRNLQKVIHKIETNKKLVIFSCPSVPLGFLALL